MSMSDLWITAVSALLVGILGCNADDKSGHSNPNTTEAPANSSGNTNDESGSSGTPGGFEVTFTHKMIKKTGENPVASLAYECPECTFEQWERIVTPDGWDKGPAQIALFSPEESEMRSHPSVDGHPETVDFLEEVPGD